MRKTLVALSVAVLLATAGASGQQQTGPLFLPYGALPVLDAYIEALRVQLGIPGMSAAVLHDGRIAWEKGYGFQNLTTRVRATPDTPYVVGDLAGTLAAVLLLQCVEQRHLDLDTPIRNYGIATAEPDVTLRQLLSHTFAEGPNDPFVYSAARYAQLTAVAEKCVPQPYRKTVAHRLVNRLAMVDSVPGTDWLDPALPLQFPDGFWAPAEIERYRRNLSRLAVPYRVDSRGRTEQTVLPPTGISASQGFVSTVRDLAALDAALDTAVLLLEDTREQAWTPAIGRRGTPVPMGLGWFVQQHRADRVVWHFGHVPNAYSSLVIKLPAKKITFILLANSDGLSAPYQLQNGDVTRSHFATVFLRLFT
jgi:CubicO group peptidase (beta-lactamase class C family)